MSEGRIERQGTIVELKEQGLLDYVAHDLAHDHVKETSEAQNTDKKAQDATDADGKPKQAKKLVEEEMRSEGSVTWSVYKTYLKAS